MDPATLSLISKLGMEGIQALMGAGQETSQPTIRDQYGNIMYWDPRSNSYRYRLTRETRNLQAAQRGEQLQQLTTDAQRARRGRERVEDFAKTGAQEFERSLNDYRYGPDYDEASLIDDMTRELMLARRKGLDEGKSVLGRQALRMNQGELLPQLIRNADELFGQTLEELVLRGKREGRRDYQSAQGFRNQELSNQLSRWGQAATMQPGQGSMPNVGSLTGLPAATPGVQSGGQSTNLSGLVDPISKLIGQLAGGSSSGGPLSGPNMARMGGGGPFMDNSGRIYYG